jgi:dihydrofolate synthase/folylpolyglutamate synthase
VAQDPLEYLFSLERLGMKFGLENISTLCAALDDPHRAFESVVVAGTNGKGSVTAMVERGLRAAGHRAARYTSPHLLHLEERFVIDGQEVATDALRGAAGRVQDAAERLVAEALLDGPPTFFEAATAIAFVLFRDARVEIAVLEVGLGGRLDATNVASPLAVAITSIDFDHQAQLGNTIESIAREKAGIVKAPIPVVCGPLPDAALRVIREVCEARGARLIMAEGRCDPTAVATDVPLSLRGAHQRANAAVAVCLLRELDGLGFPVTRAALQAALTDVVWPGRLETFEYGGAQVLLDAAHNPAGARALAEYLRQAQWTPCAMVFGAMRDKDAAGMLEALTPVCDALVCATAPSDRAMPAAELAAIARRVDARLTVEALDDPAEALARACALRSRVVAAGSIFLIGPLRGILRAP